MTALHTQGSRVVNSQSERKTLMLGEAHDGASGSDILIGDPPIEGDHRQLNHKGSHMMGAPGAACS